jgi:hypothetical protein
MTEGKRLSNSNSGQTRLSIFLTFFETVFGLDCWYLGWKLSNSEDCLANRNNVSNLFTLSHLTTSDALRNVDLAHQGGWRYTHGKRTARGGVKNEYYKNVNQL